ncbi:hypothetical protein [Bdellovibrio svalbardensis]|uniref:Uncharacterized protein n=1 Tax=Bdellovibrio svalbardensis TaxID=2972972 RepID=A0ABT6DD05_9BACT|nr:hypothetical protein [Bdellovibrio svalbardensis]MDG0814740.1 hypothetical protein [Bdellovibrio svalbardensis]
MISYVVGISILLASSLGFAKSASPQAISSIERNWATSDKYSISEGGVRVTTQGRQRMIRLRGNVIPVATMTSGEIKSPHGKGVPKDLAAEMSKLMGIKVWKKEDRGSYIAYEAPVPNEARLIKLFVSKDQKNFKYSVASIRLAYMLPTYYEAELLQRQQIEGTQAVASLESHQNWNRLFKFFVSPAYAADGFSLADLTSGFNGNIPNVNLPNINIDSSAVNSVKGSLDGLNNTVGGIKGSVDGLASAGNNVAGAGNNIASSINNASSSVNNLAGEAHSIQGTIANSTETMRSSVSDINKTLQGFQDPKTFFKIGLASGFGYTLGSMLVQFATDGAASLVKKIFYEVTGQMDPATRERMTGRGQKAWDDLQKLSEKVAEIDKNVQLRLAVLTSLNGKDPLVVANELEDRRLLLESDIRKLQSVMDKSSDNASRMQCSSAIREMSQQVELLKQMQPILQSEQPRSQAELCAGFDRMYQQWANVELQMHNARSVLLNDMVSLATGAEKATQAANESLASDRKKRNECKDSKLDVVKDFISENDCKCGAATISQKCNYLCMEQQNYQDHEKSCLNMIAMSKTVDKDTDSLVESELIRQNTTMLEDSYAKLTKSYCVQGDTSGVCNGQDGSFSMIHSRMQNQFQQIQRACGSNSVVVATPRDILDGKRKAAALAASSQPIASASVANLPKPAEGGGFFSNFFGKIASFFKNLF